MQTLRLKKYSIPEFKIQLRVFKLLKMISSSIVSFIFSGPRLRRQIEPGKYEEVERHRYEPFIL